MSSLEECHCSQEYTNTCSMECEQRREDMDQDNHSDANGQPANLSGIDHEVNNKNGDVNGNVNTEINGDINGNSPASNNSQQEGENAQQEHNEAVVPSCESNQLPESAPENFAPVASPPPPAAEENSSPPLSPEVYDDDGSLDNSPPDMAAAEDSTTITESLQEDTDSDADVGNPDQVESMGYGEQGIEQEEVTEPDSDSDDITYTDDGEEDDDDDDGVMNELMMENASPDDQRRRQVIRNSDSDTTGDYALLMRGTHTSEAAEMPLSNGLCIANPQDYNSPAHSNNSGPALGINSPRAVRHNLPSLPASLPPSPMGSNGWPDNEHAMSQPTFASIQRFVRAHNASSDYPVEMPANNAGHARAQPVFRPYEQLNRETNPQQQSNKQHINSDYLPMPGSSSSRLLTHWHVGANNQLPSTVRNMTSVNFPLVSAQQRPMFTPSPFPQAPMVTNAAMEGPNESFNHLMNSANYRPRQNSSSNFRPQNGPQANFNVVYDPNVGHASNQGRTHMRPQTISSATQGPISRQAPPHMQSNLTLLSPFAMSSMMASRSPAEQLQMAEFAREISQPLGRYHVPRPAILSRAEVNENRRHRRLVVDTVKANNTTSLLVDFMNARAIEQGAIRTANAGIPSQLNRAAEPQGENRESPSPKRTRREAVDAMNEDEDAPPPQNIVPNLTAASQPQQNLNFGATSSQPANPRGPIYNAVYDPAFERMGLPVDPHLRMFAVSDWNKNKNKTDK